MDRLFVWIMFLIVIMTVANDEQEWTGCLSPQFLELGRTGVLTCQFPKNFKAIFWFDNATFEDAQPAVTYKNDRKDGVGYLSGEYDIDSNGSLVIPLVALQHEKMYKVLSFDDDDLYSVFRISVVVTVSPVQHEPFIESCGINSKCVIQTNLSYLLKCSFTGARPPVRLEWYLWKNGQEERVNPSSYKETPSQESSTYDTVSDIRLSDLHRDKLLWLICKSKKAGAPTWDESEVLVNVHSNPYEMSTYEKETVYLEREKRATLHCASSLESILLWNKCEKNRCFPIAFKKGAETSIVEDFGGYYSLDGNGFLIIQSIQFFHEGNYTCVTSTPTADLPTTISLVVLVPPSPSYLTVAECPFGLSCTVLTNGEGTLTCNIYGVRPEVTLTWTTEDSQQVTLSIIERSSREESGLFDISAKIKYKLVNIPDCEQIFSLECRAFGPATAIFYSRKEVGLHIEKESCTSTASHRRFHPNGTAALIIIVCMLVLSLFVYGIWKHTCKRDSRSENPDNVADEENVPLQENTEMDDKDDTNIKSRLVQKLKLYYEKIFGENRDGSLIRNIYVPNNLSYLNHEKPWNDKTLMEPLESFKDIFEHQEMINKHVIVEGEVGYGKSTLAKYLAVKWSEGSDPFFSKCEILLYISLGHIGTKSLFDFIAWTLLQHEISITSNKLETLIRSTRDVWIILDDFDGYINKSFQSSEISELLKDKKSNFKILVLARPSCFLNVGDIQMPVVTLEPFSDDQIEGFVSKKFTDKELLQSPFLNEIKAQEDIYSMCHVPLYLNIFSSRFLHNKSIPHEVRSLTTLFTFVFNWFLSKKEKDSSDQQNMRKGINSDIIFHHNKRIAKLAVDGMKTSISLWDKSKFSVRERKEIDTLLKTGILVETKTIETLSKHYDIKRFQLIAFAHQIYQCYYGAHFLANSKKKEVLGYLSSLDLKSCGYMFIFTCGLCKDDSLFASVVQYLLSRKEYYPYSVNDCLSQCFYERRFSQTEKYCQLLQQMSSSVHRLHFRDRDSRLLLTAKAFVVDTCSQLKISVGTLSSLNAITRIADHYCFLKHDVKFRIPAGVRTFYIIDFGSNLTIGDIMDLLRNTKTVEEIIVYSYAFPKLHDKVDIPEGNEEVKVIWISFEGNDVSTLNYPSVNLKLWMNCLNTRAVKLLRKQQQWKSATKDKQRKMELELLEEIDQKGLEEAMRNNNLFPQEKIDRLREKHSADLKALRGFLKEFHMMYEAKSKEVYDQHKKEVLKHIDTLMTADKRNKSKTSHGDEATDLDKNEYGQFEVLVRGLKNYYQGLHI